MVTNLPKKPPVASLALFELETRNVGQSAIGPNTWICSVRGGPHDLVARESEELALRDGAAYLKEHYRFDPTVGTWRAI